MNHKFVSIDAITVLNVAHIVEITFFMDGNKDENNGEPYASIVTSNGQYYTCWQPYLRQLKTHIDDMTLMEVSQ